MKYDYLNVIGLMTGTSMDGIDISFVKTNGIDLKRLNKNYFYSYSSEIRDFLSIVSNDDIKVSLKRKKELDEVITNEHYQALKEFDILKKSDLVGFHGQTIYHNPKNKLSIQLGNPSKLANLLKKNVVFNFRKKDILMGGQGAPLAPIYHKFIIESLNLNLPACVLNIGGISNITFWDSEKLIGFDTGPGNALMDDLAKLYYDKYFDKNGIIASNGNPSMSMVETFFSNNFFRETPPKSLDRNSFLIFYKNLLKMKFSTQDKMATLAEITINSIMIALNFLPGKVKTILITGGGSKNKFLMQCLQERLSIKFINERDIGIDFDFIESELIAYLSARSIYKLPITFPSTTGTSKEISGGEIHTFL